MEKVINAHCHIYPAKVAERAVEGIKSFYEIDNMTLNGMTDDLVKDGEKFGAVHYLVHSVATVPKQVTSINDFIAEEVNLHPGLFTGFGALHPDSDDVEGDMKHLLELGLKGVKLHPDFQGFSLADSKAEMLGRIIDKAGIPVMIHCGDPRHELSNPQQLKVFLDKFPEVTVIAAHLGGWSKWDEAAELLAGKYDNLYVDCSSSLRELSPQKAVTYMRKYGVDKVIYGTDYPMWAGEVEWDYFNRLDLTADERSKILYDNAAKLLKIN